MSADQQSAKPLSNAEASSSEDSLLNTAGITELENLFILHRKYIDDLINKWAQLDETMLLHCSNAETLAKFAKIESQLTRLNKNMDDLTNIIAQFQVEFPPIKTDAEVPAEEGAVHEQSLQE